MRSREEFRRRSAERKREAERFMRGELIALKRSAVELDKLTRIPEFDEFLTYVKAQLEEAETGFQSAKEKLADPRVVTEHDIQTLKLQCAQFLARRDTLQEIMDLPKTLIERGKEASESLREIDADAS